MGVFIPWDLSSCKQGLLSSPQEELIVKNVSAQHLALDWLIFPCPYHLVELFMISDKRHICHRREENPASVPAVCLSGCPALGLLPQPKQL